MQANTLSIYFFSAAAVSLIYIFIKRKNKFILGYYLSSLIIIFLVFTGNGIIKPVPVLLTAKVFFGFTALAFLFFLLALITGYEKAYLDELTKVYGRRAMNEEMSMLKSGYSIVMADIDHFKKFNDSYGHDAGDIVLHSVAQSFEELCSGKVFRYGGEEFTLIYYSTDGKKIYAELDKIRKFIMKKKVNIDGSKKSKKEKKVSVTISIGLATFCDSKHKNPKEVLKNADQFLYKAKENGRNRVEMEFDIIEKKIEEPDKKGEQSKKN